MSIIDSLSGIPKELQPALISSATSIFGMLIGFIVLGWQIGKQATNAIRQNKENEKIKMKTKIYEEIMGKTSDASRSEIELSSFIRRIKSALDHIEFCKKSGIPWAVPRERIDHIIELKTNFDENVIKLISLTEQWEIVDPRIVIFRTAFNAAWFQINREYQELFSILIGCLPADKPDGSSTYPWAPPEVSRIALVDRFGDRTIEALDEIGCYIYDFQREMQNALLKELFEQEVPERKPIDKQRKVVVLRAHKELNEYFEKDTAWGQNKAKIEKTVRETLDSRA